MALFTTHIVSKQLYRNVHRKNMVLYFWTQEFGCI